MDIGTNPFQRNYLSQLIKETAKNGSAAVEEGVYHSGLITCAAKAERGTGFHVQIREAGDVP
jgi:hypothetical protein